MVGCSYCLMKNNLSKWISSGRYFPSIFLSIYFSVLIINGFLINFFTWSHYTIPFRDKTCEACHVLTNRQDPGVQILTTRTKPKSGPNHHALPQDTILPQTCHKRLHTARLTGSWHLTQCSPLFYHVLCGSMESGFFKTGISLPFSWNLDMCSKSCVCSHSSMVLRSILMCLGSV